VRIDKWMSRPPESVKPLDSIRHAREIMETRRINQLPVIVRKQIVGIVTDRDLRDAFPSVFADGKVVKGAPDPAKITVEQVMTSNVVTLAPDDNIENAARLMLQERFGSIPIIDGEQLVGVLTRSDILRAFVALCESMKPTVLPPAKTPPESEESKKRAKQRARKAPRS
jgi:acetoin utilization protein AcuB